MVRRRTFLAGAVGAALSSRELGKGILSMPATPEDFRAGFPRLQEEVYLNAAAATPLGDFAEAGLQRYLDFQRLGPGDGRGEYVQEVRQGLRARFARLAGVQEGEVGLVQCTKAGEQVALDGLDSLRRGGNVVTNDLHFGGSLHNLLGLRAAGLDVRIVRSREGRVSLDDMVAAMDERTALVSVTLVSNVNGHVEPIRALADAAHDRGALLYADIIQAAGVVPLSLGEWGVDVAACSAYKWLYGVHGTGFLYVRSERMGRELRDRLVPGFSVPNYPPWVDNPDPGREEYSFRPPAGARRYEPGHRSYLGECALYEALGVLLDVGIEQVFAHSVRLHRRLLERIDLDRYRCITPEPEASPLVTLLVPDPTALRGRLEAARIVVSLRGAQLRVSPALYNCDEDIDRLVETLSA